MTGIHRLEMMTWSKLMPWQKFSITMPVLFFFSLFSFYFHGIQPATRSTTLKSWAKTLGCFEALSEPSNLWTQVLTVASYPQDTSSILESSTCQLIWENYPKAWLYYPKTRFDIPRVPASLSKLEMYTACILSAETHMPLNQIWYFIYCL